MKIVILGYSGLIGYSILENLIKDTSLDLICVGRSIKKKPFKNDRVKYLKWNFNSFKKSNLLFLNKSHVIINCVGKTNIDLGNLEKINVDFVKKLLKYITNSQLKVRLLHIGSVSVYGGPQNYLGQNKLIQENSVTKANDLYSRSKLNGDILIQNTIKKNFYKNFSFTILRISNVFGKKKNSNLYSFVLFLLRFGYKIKSSDAVVYNFINVKDVSRAVKLTISNLKVSKNKIYIVSDDCKQTELYNVYRKYYKKKIIHIFIPISFIKFIIFFIPMPKKILNFFLMISSKVTYSNKKIKKELNFIPKFSILKIIKQLNE